MGVVPSSVQWRALVIVTCLRPQVFSTFIDRKFSRISVFIYLTLYEHASGLKGLFGLCQFVFISKSLIMVCLHFCNFRHVGLFPECSKI